METRTVTITTVVIAALLAVVCSPSAAAPQVPCFFIFGDSLNDCGNNNDLDTVAKANYKPYGIDFPGGPTGRFTNGRTIVDFLAEDLGFDKPISPFTTAKGDDILRGVNYASGSAGILDDSGSHLTLYQYGARKIVVVGMGRIGCVPYTEKLFGTDGTKCVDSSNWAAQAFNMQLQKLVVRLNTEIKDAKFVYVNTFGMGEGDPKLLGVKTEKSAEQKSNASGRRSMRNYSVAYGSARPQPEVPCYFIFGDSLFDSGNNNYLKTMAKANYSPYGVGFPAGSPTGRFTDGRTIADILGEVMGFESFIPPFASNPNGSELLVGVNYASGSAGILEKSGKQGGDNVDMSKQLKNHGMIVSSIVDILGSKESAYRHLAKCLYVSDMGNNDYINNYFLPQSSNLRKKYNPEQYAALLIAKYSRQLKRMYKLGARKVGLVGVSPVGCTPGAVASAGRTNGSLCAESMNRLVTPFNARLCSLIDELNVDFPDAKFMYLNSTLANHLAIQVTVAANAGGRSSQPPEVPCYFIFGDSIFDGGNNNNLATSMKANYLPYGTDFPAGPTGRFTNGQTTADVLGQLLGFDSFIPSFASKPNRSELLVGVNYASASAGILFQSGKLSCLYNLGARKIALAGVLPIGCTPSAIATAGGTNGSLCVESLNQLVAPFNSRLQVLVDRLNVDFPDAKFVYLDSTSALNLASQVTVAAAGAGGLSPEVPCYFIFGDSIFDGGNNNNLATSAKVNYLPYGTDFPAGPTGRFTNGQTTADILGQLLGFDSLIPSFASKPNRSELLVGVNYASGSAGILFESGKILDLYNLGARKVALAGVFPIGCLPRFIATPGPGGTNGSLCVESLNQLVAPFNSRLRVLVDQLNVDFPDAKFVYLDSTPVFNLASQSAAAVDGLSNPPEVPCYFIFGDSLFDNGNNNNLDTLTKSNYPPYGIAFPAGPTGRFTNGRTTADIVGELMGFKSFIPSFASNPNRSELLVGVNYASASAGILFESGKQMGDNVEMDKQISNHGVTLSSITDILGSQKAAYDHLAKCFYISNMGNNDYINNYLLPQSSDIREKYNPDQFAALLVEKYSVQIKSMYNLGARKVGLVGVSPVGCTPSAIAASGGTGGLFCDDSANRVVEPFNVRLRALVDRFNVDFPDAKFVYLDSTTASTLAGLAFPIRTVPCCEVSAITGLCIRDSVPCPVLVRHLYLFWDAFHPVEASNRLVASIFYGAIKPILVNDSPLL
ncbi:GDSL esterase/lipase At1g29670 [Linum grandiflorum]